MSRPESTSHRTIHTGASLALAALAGLASAAGAEPEPPLRFLDDLGATVPGLEVCFQVGGDRRCRALPAGEAIRWPAGATGLWAAGPGHGPIWIDRGIDRDDPARERPIGPVVVPRKAALTVDDLPAGGALSVYRADDRSFDVPLDRLRAIEPERPVPVPSGATVLAITDLAADPAGAPDLHRLDLPPGGSGRVRYTARAGWSAVVRTGSQVHRRPLPGATVRWIASSITAPRSARSELAAVTTDANGEYTMTVLADGDYLLSLHGPELGSIAARPIRVGPGGAEASFRLDAVVDGHLESLGLPRATAEDGHLLFVLAPGRWQLHRAGTSPNRIEAGDESALLGTVALDPWTVTDLYTGSDE